MKAVSMISGNLGRTALLLPVNVNLSKWKVGREISIQARIKNFSSLVFLFGKLQEHERCHSPAFGWAN
jgi:hypothetical protein